MEPITIIDEQFLSDAHYQWILEFVSRSEAFEAACVDNFLSLKEKA
jgi:hypothetical protein